MSQPIITAGFLALLLSACSSSSGVAVAPGSEVDADTDAGAPPGTPGSTPAGSPADTPDRAGPTGFLSIPDTLEESAHHAAEITREACLIDYGRLASLLGTDSSLERFHPTDGVAVDVEWIEPGAAQFATDGPVGTRQGAGVVMTGRRDGNGVAHCDVAPYESYGFSASADGAQPVTAARIDAAMLACAPDSAHPDVTIGNIPLFKVQDADGEHAYGSIGRSYSLVVGSGLFTTRSVRMVSRRTLEGQGDAAYAVECSTPASLPDGGSILLEPSPTSLSGPADGPTAFVDRPWQATASTAQNTVDARGVLALRREVERAVAALGPVGDESSDVACPLAGSATLSAIVGMDSQTHRYAFAGCTLADGTLLDGFHDSDLDRQDAGDAVRRSREERFSLQVDTIVGGNTETLQASGTLSDALTGKRADECGLLVQERVLRIDVPTLRFGAVAVNQLAIEDITNARIQPAAGAGCGSQVHEHAFSDSARVVETLADGAVRRFTVNRTGSVVLDEAGVASSSGRDALIKVYDADNDDSLYIAPDFARIDGATVTIARHPGQVSFADRWRFVER